MESKNWKPNIWLSIVIAFLSGPFVFLYTNSAKLFWLSLISLIALALVALYLNLPVYLTVVVVCIVLACFVTKRYDAVKIRRWYSKWWGFIICAIIAPVLIIVPARAFLIEPYQIPTVSMSPALEIGDIILVKKWGYGNYRTFGLNLYQSKISESAELERGDIYVFLYGDEEVPFVKRLIGKPGDKIKIQNDDVFVNNELLNTELISSAGGDTFYQESIDGVDYQIIRKNDNSRYQNVSFTLPDNEYFFLGDNRHRSADSRYMGNVSNKRFIGKVIYTLTKNK